MGLRMETGVDSVKPVYILGSLVSFVTNHLTDILTFLLFDMGIVVFAIGSTTGEREPFLLAKLAQVTAHPLGSIVRVDAPRLHRPCMKQIFNGLKNGSLTTIHDRSAAAVTCHDIHHRKGISK